MKLTHLLLSTGNLNEPLDRRRRGNLVIIELRELVVNLCLFLGFRQVELFILTAEFCRLSSIAIIWVRIMEELVDENMNWVSNSYFGAGSSLHSCASSNRSKSLPSLEKHWGGRAVDRLKLLAFGLGLPPRILNCL